MEKLKELIPIISIVVAAILIWQIVLVNSNIRHSIKILTQAESKLNSASQEISEARNMVDSLQSNFIRFGAYLNDLQGRVEMSDLQNKLKQNQFIAKRDSLQMRLAELNKKIDLTGHSLPEIKIFDSKNSSPNENE